MEDNIIWYFRNLSSNQFFFLFVLQVQRTNDWLENWWEKIDWMVILLVFEPENCNGLVCLVSRTPLSLSTVASINNILSLFNEDEDDTSSSNYTQPPIHQEFFLQYKHLDPQFIDLRDRITKDFDFRLLQFKWYFTLFEVL